MGHDPHLPVPAGTVVAGKYRIERMLGSGGMGIVVEATHLALGQGVALKILRAHALSDVDSRRRFRREARATFALKSAHTVRLLDVDEIEPLGLVMVMELLVGQTLRELIQARAPLPEADAVMIVRQACEALGEAHRKGFIHRDIKPANLFLTQFEGQPWIKVLDFGLSKALEADPTSAPLTAPLQTLGTPRYMAPEQWSMPSKVDARSDLYSLGAVFYQMLTGVVPFADIPTEQRATRLLVAPVPSPRTLRPELSEGVARIVTRLLRPVADERYETAEELEHALATLDPSGARTSETMTTNVGKSGQPREPQPTAPDIVEGPITEREPGWDVATTRKTKPPFDLNVFTGARIHPPAAAAPDSSDAVTQDSALSSAAPFDLATELVATPQAPPRIPAATLRTDEVSFPRMPVPPEKTLPMPAPAPAPAAPLVVTRSAALDAPTQPRTRVPPPADSSVRVFVIAIGVAFLVGVGLAFLMVMRR